MRHGLDIYLPGIYDVAFTVRDSGGPERVIPGRAIIRRVLGGTFVEIALEAWGDSPETAKTVIRYDDDVRKYVFWFFRESGEAFQSESRLSEADPRTTLSGGSMYGLHYKGTTTWSEDYTEVTDTYHWYDDAQNLVQTAVNRYKLIDAQQIVPAKAGMPPR
jgi:hypothetical protein